MAVHADSAHHRLTTRCRPRAARCHPPVAAGWVTPPSCGP